MRVMWQSIHPSEIKVGDTLKVKHYGVMRTGTVAEIHKDSFYQFFTEESGLIYDSFWPELPVLVNEKPKPKPKFKVGDLVTNRNHQRVIYTVESVNFENADSEGYYTYTLTCSNKVTTVYEDTLSKVTIND